MKLYEILLELKEKLDNQKIDCSICTYIDIRTDYNNALWRQYKYECFRCWPKTSGCCVFPVPDPLCSALPGTNNAMDAAEHKYYRSNHGYKYLWTGEYGQLRRELLDHCIEWFMERNL